MSTTFPVHGAEHSRVCGKIIGYQDSTQDAFYSFGVSRRPTIDGLCVDGVSLTHDSSPRKHIWTFAAGSDEIGSDSRGCPCHGSDHTYTGVIPSFIGQDYFCDSGSGGIVSSIFYSEDPLWDGQGFGSRSTCCSLTTLYMVL